MDVSEKLVELIDDFVYNVELKHWYSEELDEKLADELISHGVTVQELSGCDYCTKAKKIIADIDGDIEIVKMIPLPAIDLETGERQKKADPPYWAMRLMLDGGEDFAKIHFCPMCGRKLSKPPKGD